MLLLVLDTETTGLEPEKNTIVEIAAAVFDTESKQTLATCSVMFPHEEVPTQDIIKVTPKMTRLVSSEKAVELSLGLLGTLAASCKAVVAHNANFDKIFVSRDQTLPEILTKLPWVCSYEDLKFPTKATKLSYMCTDYGIPVSGAHRAINDVLMLCQLLGKLDDLEGQVEFVTTATKYEVQALVSFNDKQLAKDAGFKWFPENKTWMKTVIAKSKEDVQAMFDFKVLVEEKSE